MTSELEFPRAKPLTGLLLQDYQVCGTCKLIKGLTSHLPDLLSQPLTSPQDSDLANHIPETYILFCRRNVTKPWCPLKKGFTWMRLGFHLTGQSVEASCPDAQPVNWIQWERPHSS